MKKVCRTSHDVDDVLEQIHALLARGKDASVEVKVWSAKSSRSQMNTQHLWYSEIARHTGHTAEEIKEYLKSKLGPHQVVLIGTEEVSIAKPSSQYTRSEAWEYMTLIQAWCAEWGFAITNPEPEAVRAWRQELLDERCNT